MDYFLKNEKFMQALDSNDSRVVANIIYEYFNEFWPSSRKLEKIYIPTIKRLEQMFDDLGIFQDIVLSAKNVKPGDYVLPYAYYEETNFTVNLNDCVVFSDAFNDCENATYIIDGTTLFIGLDCFDGKFNNTFEFLGIPTVNDIYAINFDTSYDTIKAGPKVDKEKLRSFIEKSVPLAEFEIEDL